MSIIFLIRKLLFLSFLFLLVFNHAYSQLDSIALLKKEIKSIQSKSTTYGKDTTYIKLLNKLGWESRYTNLDTMIILAKEAYELSSAIDFKQGKIKSLLNYSGYHLYNGNPNECIDYLNRVLEFFPEQNNLEVLEVYNQMGQAYFMQAKYPDSYKAFISSLDIAEKISDTNGIIRENLNIGVMFSLLNNHTEAQNYLFKGLAYAEKAHKKLYEARILANIGFTYAQMKEYDKAIVNLDKSILVFKEYKIPEWLAFSINTRGYVALKQEDFMTASQYYQEALELHDTFNDSKGKADVLLGSAQANLGLGNHELSMDLANRSLELYTKIGVKTGQEKCYMLLSSIYKNTDKPMLALEYLERANILSDSIAKKENSTNIAMLNTRLKFEEEKNTIRQANEAQIFKQKQYVVLTLIALLVTIIIIYFSYKANKKEKNLNKQLEDKTKILIENENKLNETNLTKDRLFSIVGHDLRGPIISLRGLLKMSLEDKEGESQFRRFGPKLEQDLDHIQFTLDNLLNWGQTQMKGASTDPVTIMVKSEISEIINLFSESLRIKGIDMANELNDEMCVLADLNHFRIIFRNLINNAIKFTKQEGKIRIEGKITEEALTISVIDNGIGMSEENATKIWKNKEHFSTYGTNQEKGTGLGLSLCKEMVDKNKGTILLKSELGVGTTFLVSLPRC